MALISIFHPITNATKDSIAVVAGVLGPSLEQCNVLCVQIKLLVLVFKLNKVSGLQSATLLKMNYCAVIFKLLE